ncbi:putative copper-containig nitrite reductase [Candidatus Nitrososphaera gargensis Ga9.2]|uniref:Copper-containing nitrite reductase n=2 Tax=Candidatus Nitrososphaera gargensis TaxID=497727 RepID=K0IEZ7_NITGG|nr:putative copper-containig nitrite reductase [Candidatus Nitrososphaera gargensis Ga9.2]
MPAMNKPVIAGIVAGVLLAGFAVLSPITGLNFDVEAQSTGTTKKVTLIADEVDVQVAPDNALHPGGVMYRAMVFNGTIPGPVISVDQGDTIEFTLINEGEVIHSIDFHAGHGPNDAVGANASATGSTVRSGESVTWTWKPPFAGVFFYHCGADGLNGVWEHIANGMYGGIVVHPPNEQPAKEFYVVFGEIYSNNVEGVFTQANGTGSFDVAQFLTGNPDIVMTNGMAHRYVPALGAIAKIDINPNATIFQVKPGELTRWYIVNAGPNDGIAFHFISGMIDVRDGSIKNRYGTQLKNDETWWIPPGSGSVIEATFPQEGVYVGVDHAMNDVVKGAAFAVLATPDATDDDHPPGTMVPPRGSDRVTSPTTFEETRPAAEQAEEFEPPTGEATTETTNATDTGNQTGTGNETDTAGNETSSAAGNDTNTNSTG